MNTNEQTAATQPTWNYAELLAEYRLCSGGDPWGECMSAWFGAVGEMHWRGLDIPCEWRYFPGAGGDGRAEEEDYFREVFAGADDDSLERFAHVMSRYSDKLRTAGHSY